MHNHIMGFCIDCYSTGALTAGAVCLVAVFGKQLKTLLAARKIAK